MRVLVTWGSKPGGTEGIARSVAEGLRQGGIDAMLEPASAVRGLRGYDAAVIANHSPSPSPSPPSLPSSTPAWSPR